jgi:hypothetical protein
MYSWNDPDDRVAIVQMNAELRHAQLDLLSAQCATDRLRLRFSIGDLARYGEKDVLRKTIGTAVALHDYYVSIQNEMPADDANLSASQVVEAVQRVSGYLRNQREQHFSSGAPLSTRQRETLQSFFSPALLERVRTVELHGRRLPPPPFYLEAQSLGIENLPELTHMASLTFVDVFVFNDLILSARYFTAWYTRCSFSYSGWNAMRSCLCGRSCAREPTSAFHSRRTHSRWSRSLR